MTTLLPLKTKNRKNLEYVFSGDFYKLIDQITGQELGYIDHFDYGCLLDNYFLTIVAPFNIGRIKINRNYLICLENYVNPWTSNYRVIQTDDYDYYCKIMEQYDTPEEN
ncbi:TPA: hypothetical protein ACGO1T_001873 [Streptococcus suis]